MGENKSQSLMNDGRTEKITFTCTPGTKAYLKEWAHRERCSVSSLIERVVISAIDEDKSAISRHKPNPSIADTVKRHDLRELAEEALMPLENLQAIAKGGRPTDDDIICLGRVLEFDTVELLRMRQRDFPLAENGERKHG